jgi:hypothetical protein
MNAYKHILSLNASKIPEQLIFRFTSIRAGANVRKQIF